MSSSFDLKIYTPEEVVFNEKAVQLTASNSNGEFGILPGHTFFSSDIVPVPKVFTNVDVGSATPIA